MLRLDPGEGRIRTARQFQAWEGGGEYNVARGLRKCFGLKTAVVSAFVDNEVGHLIEDFIMQGGVATDYLLWRPDDGIGRTVRNGLNFTERGFGIRGAVGNPDRGNTAASQMKPGDVDWDQLFGAAGVRWFHTGGIFAALSETTAALTIEAVQAAKRHGTIVSYDLNYRPSLWKTIGGLEKARAVNREIAHYVDVMIGNEEDFTASLGFEVEGVDHAISSIETDAFKRMIQTAVQEYPNFKAAATTLRRVITATRNDWSAILWHEGWPRVGKSRNRSPEEARGWSADPSRRIGSSGHSPDAGRDRPGRRGSRQRESVTSAQEAVNAGERNAPPRRSAGQFHPRSTARKSLGPGNLHRCGKLPHLDDEQMEFVPPAVKSLFDYRI